MKIYQPSTDLIIEEMKKKNDLKLYENYKITKTRYKEDLDLKKNLIVVDGVSFNYPNSKYAPLKEASMKIEEGDIVGIVGQTGSGKSTLLHLIMGLLRPSKGSIFYENTNLQNILSEWQKDISFVSQNTYLLDDSIKKNITFNFDNNAADEENLQKVIKIAELENKISQLPLGLETKVGNDGILLSGGERQRIALARAIYKNPKILFLDEFTSALDQITEDKIMDNIKKQLSNKTLVIIAHRKSTIEKCKNLWEVKDGKLINQTMLKS